MTMNIFSRAPRRAAAMLTLAALGGCSSLGGLGNVLGGVLGGQQQPGQQSGQLSGSVQGVNTQSQQISIQQSNGQSIGVSYDNNTQVVYQNQNYSPTSLEQGDQVTANVQDNGNGGYYTNYVLVNQSVRGNNGTQSGTVQSFQGLVGQINRSNGWFTMDDNNVGRITVVLSNGISRADIDRFNNLRSGDGVRFYGTRTSNSQVSMRQFY